METKRLHIAIGLPNEIAKIISNEYGTHQTENISHISFYGAEFPSRNLPKVIDAIEKISQNQQKFPVRIGKLTAVKGYWFWEISEGKKQIIKIHLEIINKLNPLREGFLRDKFSNRRYLNSLPADQQKLVLKYGSQWVMDYFVPHITLQKNNSLILPVDYLNKKKFVVDNISIFNAGEHATCKDLITRFNLK